MSIDNPRYFHPEDKLPPIIGKVAKSRGINISAEETRNMIIIASACGIADDEVDRCGSFEQRRNIARNAFLYLAGEEELIDTGSSTFLAYQEAMGYFKEVFDAFPEDKKIFVKRRLRVWDRLSEDRRGCENIGRSIFLRKVDLNATADIYLSGVCDANRNSPGFNKFAKDIRKMVRIAGMIDDAMDLPDDFQNKIVSVAPNTKNRLILLVSGCLEGVTMLNFATNTELIAESVNIMRREFQRRKTVNNNVQYRV